HTYENGVLVSSKNESTGETVTYQYNGNQAVLNFSDGTSATVDLGADGRFGTADDKVVQGSLDLALLFSRFNYTSQGAIKDGTFTGTNALGQTVTNTYQNGILVSSKNQTTGE